MVMLKNLLRQQMFFAVSGGILGVFLFFTQASAASCPKVHFPQTVSIESSNLILNGIGLRKATFLGIKVYVAGLYLPEKLMNAEEILDSDRSWQLTLNFVRDVDSDDIQEAFADGFENMGDEQVNALSVDINAINELVPDVKEGDSLIFSHQIGRGILVYFNDDRKGEVGGVDLARGMLSIWLGDEPPNDDLKTGLLGGPCE